MPVSNTGVNYMTTEKKTRVRRPKPLSPGEIEAAFFSLHFDHRVELLKILKNKLQAQAEELTKSANLAKDI